ncbi:MYND-type domain-containing protein [Mycena chlorophos]|uniref:phytol kinase n=1 Tax=Mycena chlorophos TaxID=658473 RepID=A0A8H6TCA3_MYCCL|nr:MYND-type domain-containing protein [Mycena chlorophos]
MHDSLRLIKLSKLPPRIRVVAERLIRNEDVLPPSDVAAIVKVARDGIDQDRIHLLPLFYTFLDPENLAELDTLAGDFVVPASSGPSLVATRMHRLLCGFLGVGEIADVMPPGALPDVWSRCWTLIQHLPPLNSASATQWPQLVHRLLERAQVAELPEQTRLIVETPGLLELLADAWSYLMPSGQRALERMQFVARALTGAIALNSNPVQLERIFDGAGGRYPLAALVVAQLDLEFPTAEGKTSELEVLHSTEMLIFLASVIEVIGDELRDTGIVPTLTRACLSLSRTLPKWRRAAPDDLLNGTLNGLFFCFQAPQPQKYIAQAIRSGFLTLFFTSSNWDRNFPATRAQMRELFEEILPPFLPLHHIAVELKAAFQDVRDLDPAQFYNSTSMRRVWDRFQEQLINRAIVLDDYKKPQSSNSLVACSNIECRNILDRHVMKRCGGCQRRVYCSPACQRADWLTGGHRSQCAHLSLSDPHDILQNHRDRAFLLGVLNYEYALHKLSLALESLRAMLMHRNPSVEFCIEWFYNYKTFHKSDEQLLTASTAVRMLSITAHAGFFDRSLEMRRAFDGGRVQLHTFDLGIKDHEPNANANAPDDSPFHFPVARGSYSFLLRSSEGSLYSGLREVCAEMLAAGETVADLPGYQARVEALVTADEDVQAFSGLWELTSHGSHPLHIVCG